MKILRFRWTSRTLAAVMAALVASPSLTAAQEPPVPARPGARVELPLPAATNGEIPLSLTDVIKLSLANNSDLNVSVNTAESFRYNLMLNWGIFDPLVQASAIRAHNEQPSTTTLAGALVNLFDTFDAKAQLSQLLPIGGTVSLGYAANRTATNSTFSFVNPSFSSTMTLSLSQPLLRGFGTQPTYWQIDIARNSQSSAYLDFVKSVQTVVNLAEQAYWDLVYAIDNLTVKQESLKIAKDLNRITKIKIDVGSLAPIDIVQTEVGIAQAEQDIIIAEGLIGDAQDRLKRVMSFAQDRWATPIRPTDKVETEQAEVMPVDQATRTALQKRPEVLQAVYQARSDGYRYQYWKNESLPGLYLVGSYGNPGIGGSTHITNPNPPPDTINIPGDFGDAWNQMIDRKFKNWSFGLQMSYPILNRAGRGNLGVSKYNFEASKARLTTTEQNVEVDVRNAARQIDTAWRSILAARKGRELAERNLDAERKKFENGMSTTFQVNQIQRDLAVARTVEIQALAVYRKAVSGFHYAVADILEWKGVHVEPMPEQSRSIFELRKGPVD